MSGFTFNLLEDIEREIEKDIELANGEDEQEHAQRHWPDRIERQADAFRSILERHRPVDNSRNHAIYIQCATCRDDEGGPANWPCEEIRDIASIYDFRISTGDELKANEAKLRAQAVCVALGGHDWSTSWQCARCGTAPTTTAHVSMQQPQT